MSDADLTDEELARELAAVDNWSEERLAAAQKDVAEWQGIARSWQDRTVTYLERPAVVLGSVDGEAAVQAAVAGLDEQLAALVRDGTL